MSDTQTTPRGNVNRVRAFIYAVINPIIVELNVEAKLLQAGNLTWKALRGRCERIGMIQDYVDPRQLPNLSDFVREYPNYKSSFDQHDSALSKISVQAKIVYDSWTASNSTLFAHVVEAQIDRYEKDRGSMGPQFPSFNNVRVEVRKSLAEHVINNTGELPTHFLYFPLWNFARSVLLPNRLNPEFKPLLDAMEVLAALSAQLAGSLGDFRWNLSREFDVPAAPVPGLSLEE